jgi:hypothetical protein
VPESTVWPIPSAARKIADNVYIADIVEGDGPSPRPGIAMVISIAQYDRRGRVDSVTPQKLLAIEHISAPWRAVYETMRPRGTRRIWHATAKGTVAIYDIQLLGYVGEH